MISTPFEMEAEKKLVIAQVKLVAGDHGRCRDRAFLRAMCGLRSEQEAAVFFAVFLRGFGEGDSPVVFGRAMQHSVHDGES